MMSNEWMSDAGWKSHLALEQKIKQANRTYENRHAWIVLGLGAAVLAGVKHSTGRPVEAAIMAAGSAVALLWVAISCCSRREPRKERLLMLMGWAGALAVLPIMGVGYLIVANHLSMAERVWTAAGTAWIVGWAGMVWGVLRSSATWIGIGLGSAAALLWIAGQDVRVLWTVAVSPLSVVAFCSALNLWSGDR